MNRRAFLVSLTAAAVAPMLPGRVGLDYYKIEWPIRTHVIEVASPSALNTFIGKGFTLFQRDPGKPLSSVEIKASVEWTLTATHKLHYDFPEVTAA